MKLFSCILFASLALSANLVHADASCRDAAGGKVSVNSSEAINTAFGAGTTAPTANVPAAKSAR